MARALRLARRGLFTSDPNPRVGCVIADDARILGTGWHEAAGGPHAEIVALREAGASARGATAYVTLEPCSHHGRTPPCTEALLEASVARVVVAVPDPNPEVDGSGLGQLRAAGMKVEVGLLAAEAEALNAGFMMRMRRRRPWVRIKSAVSLDGRTALPGGESQWISSEASRRDVQRWRARSSAILTGVGTVLADDPAMTARVDDTVRQPLRVVVDSQWRTPPDSRILSGPGEALVVGTAEIAVPPQLADSRTELVTTPAREGQVDLEALMSLLAHREINEIQVEAGARLCGALLHHRLVDEILIYQAPVLLGDGGPGPFRLGPLDSMERRTHLKWRESRHIGGDLRMRFLTGFGD
jgi:diaminohydroxyphosphoribosylaminopyrimidine deaminase/5-amino-6-(5-phosphoribosylamino)uracil reductase